MKELYIAPEVNLIGFAASEKIAADWELGWDSFGIALTNGTTTVSETDIKIPLT